MTLKDVKECFISVKKADAKGKKHKGLLLTEPNLDLAAIYISKAKENLEDCEYYREKRRDYKLPESWFYTLYYCALAILSKFGIESRSQRCTAAFLRYAREQGLIDYDDDFIERITVYPEKGHLTDVDKREDARYGPAIKINEVLAQYDAMAEVCKKAIAQCEEIVHSDKPFKVPKELLE